MSTHEEMKEQLECWKRYYENDLKNYPLLAPLRVDAENAIWVLEQRIKEKIIVNIRLEEIDENIL
jgi:hypothetical protein